MLELTLEYAFGPPSPWGCSVKVRAHAPFLLINRCALSVRAAVSDGSAAAGWTSGSANSWLQERHTLVRRCRLMTSG